ncbi:hypothetical protein [Streptomyces boninensis]|uniref:hypothetical protein n=1 Tax=Streptomyces boninensis TaxID=2039455 RepID=UPI003B20EBD7
MPSRPATTNTDASDFRATGEDLGEELADVFRYLAALVQMNGAYFQAEVEGKITKNEGRVYRRNSDGVPVRGPEV